MRQRPIAFIAAPVALIGVALLAVVLSATGAQAGGHGYHKGGKASFTITLGGHGGSAIHFAGPKHRGYRPHGKHRGYRPHYRGYHGYRPHRGHYRPHHARRHYRPHHFPGRAVRGVGYGCHPQRRGHGRVTVCYTAYGQPFVVAGSHRGY